MTESANRKVKWREKGPRRQSEDVPLRTGHDLRTGTFLPVTNIALASSADTRFPQRELC